MSLTTADKQYIQETVTKTVIEAIEALILPHFDKIDERFKKIESRLGRIELRLDKVEMRLGKLEKRFDHLAMI